MNEIPSPFRTLAEDEVSEEYKEKDLAIKNFSLVKLIVFDIGSVANIELDPNYICESMKYDGLAIFRSMALQ